MIKVLQYLEIDPLMEKGTFTMPWQAESHWEFWQRMTAPPEPAPAPPPEPLEVSTWDLEKRLNRLARKLNQVDRGWLQPRAAYRLTGEASKELEATKHLWRETWQEIRGR